MAEPKTETEQPKELTAAQAAKLVKREVPEIGKDKKPTGKMRQVAVAANEVLDFRDYGDHVVVVTKDGQKFRGEK